MFECISCIMNFIDRIYGGIYCGKVVYSGISICYIVINCFWNIKNLVIL